MAPSASWTTLATMSWALGAVPRTSPPLAVAMAATCVPWDMSLVEVGTTVASLSA